MKNTGAKDSERTRAWFATAFGWVAGGALGLLVNYVVSLVVGESYPTTYTTFALFILGAFGGMAVADRLGSRAFKVLGVAAGIMFAVFVAIMLTTMLTRATP